MKDQNWQQRVMLPPAESSSSWRETEAQTHFAASHWCQGPNGSRSGRWPMPDMPHAAMVWALFSSATITDRTAHSSHPNLAKLFNQQSQNQIAKPRTPAVMPSMVLAFPCLYYSVPENMPWFLLKQFLCIFPAGANGSTISVLKKHLI